MLWGPTHSDKEEEEEEMEEEGVDHQPVPEIPALGVGVGGRRVHSPPVSCPTNSLNLGQAQQISGVERLKNLQDRISPIWVCKSPGFW